MKYHHYVFLFSTFLIIKNHAAAKEKCESINIAVIGGGIGGASTSHFLTKLFDGNLKIDLYEAGEIGGRLATIDINGNQYEAGGSIIHSKNQLMNYFADLLKLEKLSGEDGKLLGIWNGTEFVFKQQSSKIFTYMNLIWKYGLQPLELDEYINNILDDFANIYYLQDHSVGFDYVPSLLAAMHRSFPNMIQTSTKDLFRSKGFTSKFINELIASTIIVNYGQDTDIHSFVGCVSLAGTGGSLWAVKGGNKQVPKLLISQNENVTVIPSFVNKISYSLTDDGTPQYNLSYYNSEDSLTVVNKVYDLVVIATPLTHDHKNSIKFENLPKDINIEFNNEYQTTIATFVKGKLNYQYFGLALNDTLEIILSCNPNHTIINSIGKLDSVDGTESNVWKIFSKTSLKKTFIKELFDDIEEIQEKVWQAYPKYRVDPAINQFKLHNGLYYVNAIEWAASAMEMSAIGGNNVAILVHNDYKRKCNI